MIFIVPYYRGSPDKHISAVMVVEADTFAAAEQAVGARYNGCVVVEEAVELDTSAGPQSIEVWRGAVVDEI